MAEHFDVTTIIPTTQIEPGGTVVAAMTVSFVTKPNGIAGVVNIPAAQFSPHEVTKVAGAQAQLLEAVKAL